MHAHVYPSVTFTSIVSKLTLLINIDAGSASGICKIIELLIEHNGCNIIDKYTIDVKRIINIYKKPL